MKLFKKGAYERKKKKLERIRKELEAADIIAEDNPNVLLVLFTVGEIRALSSLILAFGLAIIATIITFGVALLSSM